MLHGCRTARFERALLVASLLCGTLSGCATNDTIEAANRAPVANAGQDVTVAPGDVVMLDGGGSFDPDDDDLIFRWELEKPSGSGAALSSANFVQTNFQPDLAGTYTATLIVSDGELDSAPDRVTVSVTGEGGNRAPTAAIAGAPELAASVGAELVLDASASSDPDGDRLRFDWSLDGGPDGTNADLTSAGGPEARLTPDVEGRYEISLAVTDGELTSPPVTVFVIAGEGAPNAPLANAGSDQSVEIGSEVALDASGSTGETAGAPLTFEWSIVRAPAASEAALASTTGATTRMTPDAVGEYEVQLVVSSAGVSSLPDSVVITATGSTAVVMPASRGDVLITEFYADAIDESAEEWFELHNPGTATWDLMGCVISDNGTDTFTITSSIVVAAGAYVALAKSSMPGFTTDYDYGTSYDLANGGDEIIVTCGANVIDEVFYTSGFPFESAISAQLKAGQFDATANDLTQNWCAGTATFSTTWIGTPGAAPDCN